MEALLKITFGLMIASIFACFKGSDALCNTENRFGRNCDFVCHCLYGRQCDRSTGKCPNGCDFDWVGPGCQRRNLARSQNGTLVIQASILGAKVGPHLATDRNLSSCSRTQSASSSKVTPWWRIWFPYRHIITHITILTENAYRVMVENVTDDNRENNGQFDPITCYTHANATPTSSQINVTCDSIIAGNQIRIKLAHTKLTLVLCDVRIYGECEDGAFDHSCTDKCSPYCLEACDKDKMCAHCAPGWTGSRCEKMCSDGTYGEDCKSFCSGNCKDNATCRKDDGICVDGCSFGFDGEKCEQKGLCNKENRFGQNCNFVCHCLGGKQCGSITGNCINGCDFDWVGPGCQRKNLARGENGTYVGQASYRNANANGPKLAIDNNFLSCSKTQYAAASTKTPWWRIWLPEKHRIKNILILTGHYYTDQFSNFTVMIENVTYDRRTDNTEFNPITCYRHGNYVPTLAKINIICDKMIVGNQIRIKLAQEKLTLALCDVRIYEECEDGTYGYNCGEKCSPYCQVICDKDNGSCDACAPGWKGDHCDQECEDGKYGRNCAMNCSGNCKNNTVCSKADGYCTQGCSDGYIGIMCNESCTSGLYGPDCSQNCSAHCSNNSVCSFTDGICFYGCEGGWTGDKCDQTCISGQYGQECSQNCSGHCTNNSVCRFIDGKCFSGCEDGWTGDKCDQKCLEGTYGQKCAYNCSHNCLNGSSCMHTNGTCEHGCDPGWTGETCHKDCITGQYGPNCSQNCSGHCSNDSVCRFTDGICSPGCEDGWTGSKCDEECVTGTYGQDCSLKCSKHCANGSVCRLSDGTCLSGCIDGWMGTTCNEICPDGYYGYACLQKCGNNCIGGYSNCDNVYGSCMSGCTAGWRGRKCDEVCQSGSWGLNCANKCGHCTNGICGHSDGVCSGGCAAGFKRTPHCDEECADGSYGIGCSEICSKHCKDICRKQDGECQNCGSGWHGAKCTFECDDGKWGENCDRTCLNCNNHTCNRFNGTCKEQCKPGFKQTKYCDQECRNGWHGINCSRECNPNCKDVASCRKTDGTCSQCKPGFEGTQCEKATKQTVIQISGGGLAGIVLTGIVLCFLTAIATLFVARRMKHTKIKRPQNTFENETVYYSNALAESTILTVNRTQELTQSEDMDNIYDTIRRKSGNEHTYE